MGKGGKRGGGNGSSSGSEDEFGNKKKKKRGEGEDSDEEVDLASLPLFRIKTDPSLEHADDLAWAAGTLLPLLSPEALAMSLEENDKEALTPLDPSELHEPLTGMSPFGIRTLAAEFRAALAAAWASIGKENRGRTKSKSRSNAPAVGSTEAMALRTEGANNASTGLTNYDSVVPF